MRSSHDDFDRLRSLLACKRYEQPPPGYFQHFSDRIIGRIEVEELSRCSNWWDWLLEKLEAKPIVACAYGLAVSSLLLIGFRFSETFDHKVAEASLLGELDLASLPSRRAFSGTFGSVGLFDRPAVAYTTSLSPALRQEPLADLYRGQGLRVQMAGFNFSH